MYTNKRSGFRRVVIKMVTSGFLVVIKPKNFKKIRKILQKTLDNG